MTPSPARTTLLLLLFAGLGGRSHALSGRVHDLQDKGLSGISLRFVMEQDTSVQLSVTSKGDGTWILPSDLLGVRERNARGKLAVPTSVSFAQGVRIPWMASQAGNFSWRIFDLRGRSVASGQDWAGANSEHEIIWDGRSLAGGVAATGVYYLYLAGAGGNAVVRLFKTSAGAGALPPSSGMQRLRSQLLSQRAQWNDGVSWVVRIDASGYEPLRLGGFSKDSIGAELALCPKFAVPYAVDGKYLARRNAQGGTDRVFLRGMNLGVAIPGTQPGELAATRAQIRRWLARIGSAGFNCIRTYTLHFPYFYEELAAYNNEHWKAPLYLFQGVWLDEEIPADLYQSTQLFADAMKEGVDCIHGRKDVAVRFGRAYGTYRANVSPWTMGWIVGREVYPDQILTTDQANPDRASHAGSALGMLQGSPSEVWFTQTLDGLVMHERETYGSERPVSVSSWPTLDPLSHPNEVYPSQEDDATLDMNNVDVTHAPGGYFASYHAYPYYPDFMSVQAYQTAQDSMGPNSYLGYLQAMRKHYDRVPLVVAEFGVPSSWGNAHFAFSGMHHGGHDEATQGRYDVRQLENIHAVGCAGGFVFSWIDEWFKKSWITEPISTVQDRRALWHDLTNPEQNFGMVSFDVPDPSWTRWPETKSSCGMALNADMDHAFFHVRVKLGATWTPTDSVEISFDTYDAAKGEQLTPSKRTLNNRAEFTLRLQGDSAQLYVTRAYDLFGIWHKVASATQLFHSTATSGDPWNLVRWKNNRGATDIFEIGRLRVHDMTGASASLGASAGTSLDAVTMHGDTADIRIPWTLLQFTDPSLREVMDDDRTTAAREVAVSDGIAVTAMTSTCRIESPRLTWDDWNEAPATVEREKSSLKILENALKTRDWSLVP
jgi:hypothetical protein